MKTPLNVLFVEDSPDDAELETLELERAGFDVRSTVVTGPEELVAALAADWFDLVISDYRLPGFGGLDAMKIIRQTRPDVPVLLVSGTIGEDAAVEAIKAGADDYVLKDNLVRLGRAVNRELEAAQARRERRRAETANRLLTALGAVLPQSLELETVLGNIATVALEEEFADWCALDVLENERLVRVVVRHRDPAREPAAQRLLHEFPADEHVSGGPWVVVRTGKPVLHAQASDDGLMAIGSKAEHQQALAALGTASVLVVALKTQDRILATAMFARSDATRRYDAHDVQLADEVARRSALAVENARLYRAAQDAIRVRDEFLAIASHELRTPITALQLQLDGMRRTIARPDAPEMEPRFVQRLEQASRSVQRLGTLVEHLLDVSRLTAQGLELERAPTDLGEIVREVCERLRPAALQAGTNLTVHAPAVVGEWDRLRLEQVVTNVVENAVKYGLGRPVEVSVERHGDKARLDVRDHGIGIAEADLSRIFGRFERAASSLNYGGLGLGLFISRRIVEAHGGAVHARQAEGGGAVFTVELPLKAE